jgi:hypothetical protein
MKYYVSRHEYINIKQGKDFAALLHRDKSDKAVYAVDIAVLTSCHACDTEFVLEEKNEHENGDFCDHCLKVHGV